MICFLFELMGKLQLFLTDLNNYNPHIKLTDEFDKGRISFLDLKVSFCDGELTTDLHVEPTDRHQYLHYMSVHPNHTKQSMVYSQERRLSRICSYKNDFEKHLEEMKSWFRVRGYPDNLVKKEIGTVTFSKSTGSKSKGQKSIAITFYLKFKLIGQLLNKQLHILYVDQETKASFQLSPWLHFVVQVSLAVT